MDRVNEHSNNTVLWEIEHKHKMKTLQGQAVCLIPPPPAPKKSSVRNTCAGRKNLGSSIAQQELGEQGMGLCMPVTLDAVYRIKKGNTAHSMLHSWRENAVQRLTKKL